MKTLLTALLLIVFSTAYSQRIYQCGKYPPQKLRPTDTITIRGGVLNKYKVKFFNWVTVVNGNITYKISVVDTAFFNRIKAGDDYVEFNNCFKLYTNQWKRKIK